MRPFRLTTLTLSCGVALSVFPMAAPAGTLGIPTVFDATGKVVGPFIPGCNGSFGAVITTVGDNEYAINLESPVSAETRDMGPNAVLDPRQVYFRVPKTVTLSFTDINCSGTLFVRAPDPYSPATAALYPGLAGLAQGTVFSTNAGNTDFVMYPVLRLQQQLTAQSLYQSEAGVANCYNLSSPQYGAGFPLGAPVNITASYARPFRVANVALSGTPAPAPAPSPAPAPAPSTGFSVQQIDATYDGPASYCRRVSVRNDGATAANITVTLTVQGTVSNATYASFRQSGQSAEFRGLSPVAPGAAGSFDYCANR